ncbi:ABC transporter substrate-binding protein [Streptomyces caatingaensis]|uniref:Fe/B12 periplasmic-binding domain-containing protein n=1 Tax=Streptomyces caatingaensis TaxID=1678637 RepID=A0A0K9X9B2_9ACTN|nr:ABC transporter substrate-binding protein [Streptomyces caatingaensis]KNB49793.1 hypothetical protein AC230_23805 [Streptomyces caatingaensis]
MAAALRGWSRRRLLGAAATGAFAALTAGCAVPRAPRPSEPARWTFRDDTGKVVTAPRRPRRIVAYSTAAATLWDYGIHAVGVYGALQTRGGGADPTVLGAVDLGRVAVLGRTWGQINLEVFGGLSPDLVVDPLQFGGHHIDANALGVVGELAPVASVEIYSSGIRTSVRRSAELARALGADGFDGRRREFEAARARLAKVAAARRDVSVLFASADPDGLRIARRGWPVIGDLESLGVSARVPDRGESVFMEKVSWENADRRPADLILLDVRTSSLQRDQLRANRVWRALPAVRAGQTGTWNPEPVLSYRAMTGVYDELARTLAGARPLAA